MKKIFKSLALVAAAAAVLASCQKPEIENPVKEEGSKVVYFGTQVNDMTKASLTTEDDKNFIANWENNDVLNVSGLIEGEWYSDFSGTWDAEKNAFAVTGADDYFDDTYDFIGVYPQAVEGVIDFGSARTQDGNNYAGKYDVMCSEATSLTLVEGETFVLPMDRQTAIAYFHLTSTLPEEEKIVSATLSVNENLAGSFSYSEGTLTSSKSANSITLSFTNAPSVRDLKLWFNVLPGAYTGLKLEVETENHTLTLNNASVTYEAGKLYKVAGNATAKYELKPEEVTIEDFLPNEDNADVYYKVTGKVKAIANTQYGNLTIEDQTGTLSVRGLTATKTADHRNDQSFASLELKVGDVITICGPHGTYNSTAQIGGTFDGDAVPAYYVSTLEVPSVVAEAIVDVPAAGVDSEIQDATYTAVDGWNYAVTVDGTVVTAAELDSEGILYSVSANNGEARNGWMKFTFTNSSCLYQHVEIISVAQLTGVAPAAWNATALADIPEGAEIVITMAKNGTTYALSKNNTNGQQASGSSPAAVTVSVADGALSATPDELLVWNISREGEILVLTPVNDDDNYLYTTDSNSGVRVGTSNTANKDWKFDSERNYLYESQTGRYIGVYNNADWRGYKLSSEGEIGSNITGQTLVFYVKDDGKQNQSDFAFAQTTATATVGAAFTEPSLNGKLTSEAVVFSSSNTDAATVDPSTGKVTLVKAGTTVIKAIAPADETYREAVATYTLTVKHVLSLISLNTENVTKEFIPSDTFTSEGLVVTAHYNDNTEAVVTQNAEVIAPSMEEGEHIVTVRYTEDDVTKESSYTINVEHRDIAVTGVSLDVTSKTLVPSGTVQLTATVAPANATNKKVEWSTDDDQVATVSESGLVTAVGAGDAVITVRSVSDNTKYATCAIKVQAIGTLSINFEKATDKYTSWTFTNITSQNTDSNVSAHSGSYFGTTGGKATGSLQTKNKVSPKSIVFYISKTSTNTTSSNWKIQTSANGINWTDARTVSASSVTRGTWTEVTYDFTSTAEVYVRVYYDGTTATRTIDDLVLTIYGEGDPAPRDPVKLDAPTGLDCTAQTSSSLTFSWNAVSNASDYKVSLDNQSSWISTNKATTYTWTGLDAEQTKTIYVKAIGDGEEYTDSDAVSANGTTEAGSGGGTVTEYNDAITSFTSSSLASGWSTTGTFNSSYYKMKAGQYAEAQASTLFKNGSALNSDMKIEVACGTFGTWSGAKTVTLVAKFYDDKNEELSSVEYTTGGLNSTQGTYRGQFTLKMPSDPSKIAYMRVIFQTLTTGTEARLAGIKLNYSTVE